MAGHPARQDPFSCVNIVEFLIDDPNGVVHYKLVNRVMVLHKRVDREVHSGNGSKDNIRVNEVLVVG